jgi:hypothetical protein
MWGEYDFVYKYNELTFISVTFVEGGLYRINIPPHRLEARAAIGGGGKKRLRPRAWDGPPRLGGAS